MEREWTEKEPVVSESPYGKEAKKDQDNAEQPPKLTMKLLYGMIQELQQYSERIAARIEEFEVYLIQVQAARAQLEASAASTIARTKAAEAAMRERPDAQNDAVTMREEMTESAFVMEDADETGIEVAAGGTLASSETLVSAERLAAAALNAALSEQVQAIAASLVGGGSAPVTVAAADDGGADTEAEPAAETVVSASSIDGMTDGPSAPFIDRIADDLSASASLNMDGIGIELADADEVPVYMRPAGRENGSDDLMTLAMEVLGFPYGAQDEGIDEDDLDPGEGVNPFDPDGFALGSADAYDFATAGASSEPRAQTSSPGSGLTSPFFMPRSQRHQGAKKKFLNLFGFRTRIS